MPSQQTVLLVGGTGRTGQRVLEQLTKRDVRVRVIARSPAKLQKSITANPAVTVIESDLLALSDDDMQRHLRGCQAVISCLGHVISLKGLFGPPRDLVTQATTRLCRGIEALRPAEPVRFILMSSVSVNRPGGLDTRRGTFERLAIGMMRGLIPPVRDNQQAADYLWHNVGSANPFVQWVAVRPDTLLDGDISEYTLHEGLVGSVRTPDSTNMANVAHFMCELALNPETWDDWKGKFPVIVNKEL
jgi:nucleoside-diphosphate-sugar epimerase